MKLVTLVFLAIVCVANSLQFQQLDSFTVDNPSFLALFPRSDDNQDTLWITEFTGNPFASGKVSFIDNIYSYASNFSNVQLQVLYEGFAWPNLISRVPKGAVNGHTENAVLVPDGFLVPGKDNGAIWYVSTDSVPATPLRLDRGQSGYFYHHAIWRDMNNDGLLDILTCRATKPLFGSGSGELLWLEQPSSGDPLQQAPWVEHVITPGPDFFFEISYENTTAGTFQLAAAQFFTSEVVLYEIDNNTGNLLSQTTLQSDSGPFEGILLADLNNDGNKELVVNSHVGGSGGAIYAYVSTKGEATFDTRYTLASNFPVVVSGFNSASPGFPYVYLPPGATGLPSILVAGDDAGGTYCLDPTSSSFNYTFSVIRSSQHTTGALGLSSDSKFLFVPDYEGNFVVPYAVQA